MKLSRLFHLSSPIPILIVIVSQQARGTVLNADQGLLIGNSLASESGSGTLKIENSGTYDGQLVFSDSDGAKWVSGNQVHAEEVKLSGGSGDLFMYGSGVPVWVLQRRRNHCKADKIVVRDDGFHLECADGGVTWELRVSGDIAYLTSPMYDREFEAEVRANNFTDGKWLGIGFSSGETMASGITAYQITNDLTSMRKLRYTSQSPSTEILDEGYILDSFAKKGDMVKFRFTTTALKNYIEVEDGFMLLPGYGDMTASGGFGKHINTPIAVPTKFDFKADPELANDATSSNSGSADGGDGETGTNDSGNTDSGNTDSNTNGSGTNDSGNTDSNTSGSGTNDSGNSDSNTNGGGTNDSGNTDSNTSGNTDSGTNTGGINGGGSNGGSSNDGSTGSSGTNNAPHWSSWTAPSFSEDIPRPAPISCKFVNTVGKNIGTIRTEISRRGRLVHDYDTEKAGQGQTSIRVTDQRCGVRDDSNLHAANVSEICYSQQKDKNKSIIQHRLRLSNMPFSPEITDPRRPKFKNRKQITDKNWNELFLTSTAMHALGFDRASVIAFEDSTPGSYGRRKRNVAAQDPSTLGVTATMLVAFRDVVTLDDYESAWTTTMNGTDEMGSLTVDKSESEIEEPPTCRSPEEILKLLVPSLIWEATIASGFNATNPVTIGTTIDFICPEGTAKDKLSKDDDRFTYNDDKYTILCSTNRYWLVPREWPTCVPSCWMRLPVPPPHSGLEAVVPTNTIPVGQHGKYVCKDRTLGIERSSTEYFEVKCKPTGLYDVPKRIEYWPVCRERTTTVNPIISWALQEVRKEDQETLEESYLRYHWQEGDEGFVPAAGRNHLLLTTIPAFIVMMVIILLICYCSHERSPVHMLCADKVNKPKKIIRPLVENEDP